MPIYKNPLNNNDIFDMKISIKTSEMSENFHFKNLKGNKTLDVHLLPPDDYNHGPRYKVMLNDGKSLVYVTRRPNGKLLRDKCKLSADKRLGEEYYELMKAIVMKTFDGALDYFNTGDKKLINKRESDFNGLSTSEKKALIKEYDKKFL